MLHLNAIIPKRTSRTTLLISILITLLVIWLVLRSFKSSTRSPAPIKEFYTEPYTPYTLGPKNGNAMVKYTSRSSKSDQYGIYLYQVTGLVVPGRNKNVMKYVDGGLVGEKVSGKSGAFGWMIGVVKPQNLDGYKMEIAFDKPVTLFDGEVNGPFTINKMNTPITSVPTGKVYINNNVVRLNFPSTKSQVMISLRYV